MVIINNEKEFESLTENGVTLVDFYASWCGPCKMLAPYIEEISEEYNGRINVCKVDVDQVESLAYKYNIRSIPALIIFKDGKVMDISVGFQDKKTIAGKINKYLD